MLSVLIFCYYFATCIQWRTTGYYCIKTLNTLQIFSIFISYYLNKNESSLSWFFYCWMKQWTLFRHRSFNIFCERPGTFVNLFVCRCLFFVTRYLFVMGSFNGNSSVWCWIYHIGLVCSGDINRAPSSVGIGPLLMTAGVVLYMRFCIFLFCLIVVSLKFEIAVFSCVCVWWILYLFQYIQIFSIKLLWT